MEPLRLPSCEEIHIAYVQGEEAVVALIAELAENWVGVVQQQQQTIQALTVRIEALENQLTKNRPHALSAPQTMKMLRPGPLVVHLSLRQRAHLVRRSITRWYHESAEQADLGSLRYR
jgi:translation initiation factor 2B subunit (eIF-2B alpha/beta/delta family)